MAIAETIPTNCPYDDCGAVVQLFVRQSLQTPGHVYIDAAPVTRHVAKVHVGGDKAYVDPTQPVDGSKCGPMPPRFGPLAAYNRRVAQGVVHSIDYDNAMTRLQREYDAWAAGGC